MRLRSLPAPGHARSVDPLLHIHFGEDLGQFHLHEVEEHLGGDGLELEALHVALDEFVKAGASDGTLTFLQKETALVIGNGGWTFRIRVVGTFQAGLRRVHADALA